ncbi:hypothetical protein AB0D62_18255 [Streptomyces massasporeus]
MVKYAPPNGWNQAVPWWRVTSNSSARVLSSTASLKAYGSRARIAP